MHLDVCGTLDRATVECVDSEKVSKFEDLKEYIEELPLEKVRELFDNMQRFICRQTTAYKPVIRRLKEAFDPVIESKTGKRQSMVTA